MKKSIAILLTGLVALSLAACNTIAGAGRDTQAVGGAVEEAANDAAN